MRERRLLALLAPMLVAPSVFPEDVLQHHLHGTRDGAYVDSAFTPDAVARMHLDPTFTAAIPGPTHAQPLFVNNGPGGLPAIVVATEQNVVMALNASNGSQIWARTLGDPVDSSNLTCGNIDPVGITGTPVIDANNRVIYVAALTTPDGGSTKQHQIFALALDDGSILQGWPFDVSQIQYGGVSFDSTVQNQRGALLLNSGMLYVPYGGHAGDCGDYRGWVVAVPVGHPVDATAWATGGGRGGIWAPGGIATDGNYIFAATGNTDNPDTWAGGEAIIRLRPDATFSGAPADYFTPSDWASLDNSDSDLGGSGPLLIDAPQAQPSKLVVALGKNGVFYLLDRNSLGGVGSGDGQNGEGLQSKLVSAGELITAAASYTTASGTYVVFSARGDGIGCLSGGGNLIAVQVGASSPPTITVAWCADNAGQGAPIVTTTDGSAQPVVWTIGSESCNCLRAFDGETGALLYSGDGSDQMSFVSRFQTPIAANGRIFVAADNQLYAFTADAPSPTGRR